MVEKQNKRKRKKDEYNAVKCPLVWGLQHLPGAWVTLSSINALLEFPHGNFGQVNSFLCLILPLKQELQYYLNSGQCNQDFREMQNKFPRDPVVLVKEATTSLHFNRRC